MTKIVLCHIYPPIPARNHDWCAYEDGREEDGDAGWGTTPMDALIDFANCGTEERFDNSASPLIAALKRALAVMDEALGPTVASDDVSDLQARLFDYDERLGHIEGDIREALRLLGETSQ